MFNLNKLKEIAKPSTKESLRQRELRRKFHKRIKNVNDINKIKSIHKEIFG